MKIKTKVLVDFLKKVTLEGGQQIREGILKFEKEGLKFGANNPNNLVRATGILFKRGFDNYEELGNIGFNELPNLIRVLDRFGEFVTLTKEGNLLTAKSDGKKVEIELTSEEFITTDTTPSEMEHDETFLITGNQLKSIFTDVGLNKDAEIFVITEPKKVKFENTGKYKFTNEINAEKCKGGTKVKFGQPFLEALKAFNGNLEVSVKTDYPIKVMEKDDNSVVTVIVAPLVEEA